MELFHSLGKALGGLTAGSFIVVSIVSCAALVVGSVGGLIWIIGLAL